MGLRHLSRGYVYAGISNMRFGTAAVDSVYEDLRYRTSLAEIHRPAPHPLLPQREIRLRGVSFAYPPASASALRNIDTAVPVGTSVGLAGGTGAGKTTLVDIVLGLLPPSEGELLVDDTPIAPANLRAWQRALGYVPQEIFLTDSSVAENIALGVRAEDIDGDIVQRCGPVSYTHLRAHETDS